MRTILQMAMKDLMIMRRDPAGLFFIVGFPILMGVFFGFVYQTDSAESAQLTVVVVDEDDSEMSQQFIDALTKSGNVAVRQDDRASAQDRVRRGQLVGMIVLPAGFGETAGIMWQEGPAIEVGVDPSRKAEAAMLEGFVMQAMGELMTARFSDPASMRPYVEQARERLATSDDVPEALRPLLMQLMSQLDTFLGSLADVVRESDADGDGKSTTTQMQLARIDRFDVTREYEPGSTAALVSRLRSPWDITFPQSMLWGVLACSAGFAITIVRERSHGTMTRLEVAPISRGAILAGKATACGLSVLGVLAMMVLLGLALGMRPASPGLLIVASLSVSACFVGIMMLTACIGKTEEAVGGAGWCIYVILAMFGGGMIPLAFMPDFMKTLGNLSPVKWSILALEGAIWRGFTLTEMLLPCIVLVSVGSVCAAAGNWLLSRSR